MEKITKDISEIIAGEIKTINDKVRGLNFLELLKASIVEKLLKLVRSRHINISISYFLKSMSISKKKIDNDSLFISLNELSNFDIYGDNKEFTSLVLYKNTGLSLPKDTVLNAKYSKNLLLIEITNNDYEQILTK